MSHEKTVGPVQVLSFAVIELDTVRSEARLPSDKGLRCVYFVFRVSVMREGHIERIAVPDMTPEFYVFCWYAIQSFIS